MNFIIAGILFVICVFIGFKIASSYKRKLNFVNDFKSLLDYLETNILYLQDNLQKLINDKLNSFHADFKDFLQKYMGNLQNCEEFLGKWVQDQKLVDSETADIIKKFLLSLGRQDSSTQLQTIKQTNEILSKRIDFVQNEQKKGVLSAKLGVMGGLALFIIVI